jgi:hypothetical protein
VTIQVWTLLIFLAGGNALPSVVHFTAEDECVAALQRVTQVAATHAAQAEALCVQSVIPVQGRRTAR